MKHQLEHRDIAHFLVLAEELHFRKSADLLYLSQPALSRQIKKLESQLGLKLFDRHNRKVELTTAGAYLKEEWHRHMSDLERTIEHARLLHDGRSGQISIGYVGSAIQKIIPSLLLQLQKDLPDVIYSLEEMDNLDQVESVLSRRVDIGFVRLERVPDSLSRLPLLTEPFCLVVPDNHELTYRRFRKIDQLQEENFILFEKAYSPSYYEKVMQIFDDAGFTPKISHKTIHSSSIYKLVSLGFGISIIPQSLQLKHYQGVRFINLNRINQRTVLSAIWHKDIRNPVMPQLLDYLEGS